MRENAISQVIVEGAIEVRRTLERSVANGVHRVVNGL